MTPITVRCTKAENGIMLRKAASLECADAVGTALSHGTPLYAHSWNLENGFLLVSLCDDASVHENSVTGYILPTDITITYWKREFKELDGLWWSDSWRVGTSDCWVNVSHSRQTLHGIQRAVQEEGFNVTARANARDLHLLAGAPGCTYVSLEIGRPVSCSTGLTPTHGAHVTLGYLSAMSMTDLKQLDLALNTMLQKWCKCHPSERPTTLMCFRNFWVSEDEDVCSTSAWRRLSIAELSKCDVERLLERRRIEPIHHQSSETLEDFVMRIWQRDSERLKHAEERSVAICPHNGELLFTKMASGLHHDQFHCSACDLLAYLADYLMHFAPGYCIDAKGKRKPPFVTTPEYWHVSRPCDWGFIDVDD